MKNIKKIFAQNKNTLYICSRNQLQTRLISSDQVFFMFGVLVWGIVFWETSDDVSFFCTNSSNQQ